MKCQVEKLEYFRHILLFEFNRGSKAAEAAGHICAEYEDIAIGESTEGKWFSRFKEDRFDISDTPRSERSSGFDEDHLNTLIHNDPRSMYSRTGKCDELWPLHHRANFAFKGKVQNRVYGYLML